MKKSSMGRLGFSPRTVKGPVLVCREGETLELSEDEQKVLMLGPKFCVLRDLDEANFEGDIEECIIKFKWDKMGDEGNKKKHKNDEDLDDLLEILLDEGEKQKLEEEILEMEARCRMIYDEKDGSLSMARKRVTDYKGNTRVVFPPEGRDIEVEGMLDMVRRELMGEYQKYVREKCKKGGKQISNLSKGEQKGLESLKKRVADGSIVILPTDKSGRFAVMSRETYEIAGAAHTSKDLLVNDDEVKETQSILNGNVSMLLKVFGMGKNWNQVDRCRETMINLSIPMPYVPFVQGS